jgi:hypothetical protein
VGWAQWSPEGGRQAPPVARWGATGPLFFQRPRCKFEEKKLHLGPVALWEATGGIFEIFQNGHIFLKFLFLKNIKKKKTLHASVHAGDLRSIWPVGCHALVGWVGWSSSPSFTGHILIEATHWPISQYPSILSLNREMGSKLKKLLILLADSSDYRETACRLIVIKVLVASEVLSSIFYESEYSDI